MTRRGNSPQTGPQSQKSTPERPYIIGVLSDMHVGIIHRPTLEACEDWCADVQPDELFLNGDTFDFASLSTYPKDEDALACAIEEIVEGVKIINRLKKHTKRMRIQWGNHCKRWEKTLIGANAQALKGAKGLTLKDQCQAQGLDKDIEWVKETAETPGVWLSRDLIARHGDMQSGKFGGCINIATNRLNRNNGVSEIVGHHHRAQIAYRTAHGRMSFAMALPTMAKMENYMPGADWQRGWATLSLHKTPRSSDKIHSSVLIQPDVVVVQDGIGMWGGKIYGSFQP